MQEFLAAVAAAEEKDEVLRRAAEFYRRNGFEAMAYMFPSPGDPERMELINLGFSTEVIDLYNTLNLPTLNPHPTFVTGRGKVFAFSELSRHDGFDRSARELLSTLAATGLPDGLAIPAYGLRATTSLFCVGMPKKRDAVLTADRVSFQAMAQQAQLRIDQIAAEEDDAAIPNLSAREQQILRWIAAGKSNSELAIILGISQPTVATYVKRLFAKLGVHDRVAAAVSGLRLGLVR